VVLGFLLNMQIFNFYGFLIQLLLKFLLFSLNFMKNSGTKRFLAPAPVPRLATAGAGTGADAGAWDITTRNYSMTKINICF